MRQIEWCQAVEIIKPHLFKISTPRGYGTGFLISHVDSSGEMYTIATAAHVIEDAHDWEQPIRIHHVSSGKTELLHYRNRAVFLDLERDTAAILIAKREIPLPNHVLPLGPKGRFLAVGYEIGWLGFPAISKADMCFFSGRVSATIKDKGYYLVDGVGINGVSGGPAFFLGDNNYPQIMVIGVVTAYIPNFETGEALPGMSMVQNVEQFHKLTENFVSIAQAKLQESQPARWRPMVENNYGSPTGS